MHLVKYKEDISPQKGKRGRKRTRCRFTIVSQNKNIVKLKGKTENGTPWYEYVDIDEIEEIK